MLLVDGRLRGLHSGYGLFGFCALVKRFFLCLDEFLHRFRLLFGSLFRLRIQSLHGVEQIRCAGTQPLLRRLFRLLSADLLNGVNQRRLVRCTNAEWPNGLPVCSAFVYATFWRFFPDLIGELMRLEPQQHEPVTQFTGVVHQGGELFGLQFTRTQLDQARLQIPDQIFQILECPHVRTVSSPKLPANDTNPAGRAGHHQRGTVNASTTSWPPPRTLAKEPVAQFRL